MTAFAKSPDRWIGAVHRKRSPTADAEGLREPRVSDTQGHDRNKSTIMKTCPISPICSKNAWDVNNSTVDAIEPTRFDSRLIRESVVYALLDFIPRLRPFGRQLDFDLTGEVADKAVRAASRGSICKLPESDLVRSKRLAWPIACRVQARELKARAGLCTLPDIENLQDQQGETPYRLIETECAVEAAKVNLVQAGMAPETVTAVVLHFLGWSPAQIAERFGHKVEAVRKRIYRCKSRVRNELRYQFSSEVN